MSKGADPFWGIVESYGVEKVLALPEWLVRNLEASREVPFEDIPITMKELQGRIAGCMKCELGRSRTNIVFGEGNPSSGILVIGEGPGATEDETGRPFVGKSGKLLDRIFESIGLDRESLFIANIVKCRPPGNRTPSAFEAETCGEYLQQQIEIIKPGIILVLGASAARYILQTKSGIGILREKFHAYGDTPVLVTYHPAALLRSPALKRPVWEDMKLLKSFLDKAALPRKAGGEK